MSRESQVKERLKSEAALTACLSSAVQNQIGELLVNKTFPFRRFHNNDDFATIRSYDDSALSADFDWNGFAVKNAEEFLVPFSVFVPVRIDFYIGKEDFVEFEEDEDKPGVSDHNDHVYEAEYETEIIVEGKISVYLEKEVSADSPDLIDEESIEIDAVTSIEDASSES